MMKNILITILLSMSFLSCSPEELPEIKEIELEGRIISMFYDSATTPVRFRSIEILDGNGGYKVFQPREIYSWKADANVANDKNVIGVTLVENTIIVERLLPDGEGNFIAPFLVMDKKGAKRIFVVISPWFLGTYDFELIEAMEAEMFPEYQDHWYVD